MTPKILEDGFGQSIDQIVQSTLIEMIEDSQDGCPHSDKEQFLNWRDAKNSLLR